MVDGKGTDRAYLLGMLVALDRVVDEEAWENGHARNGRGLPFETADEGVMLTTAGGTVLPASMVPWGFLGRACARQ